MMRQDTKDSIDRYVQFGLPPGGFVTAVLENDLFGAMNRADLDNRENLFWVCEYVYNKIPMQAWGTPKKVGAWMEMKHNETLKEVVSTDCNEASVDRGPVEDVGI